jgi:hypothetical protein
MRAAIDGMDRLPLSGVARKQSFVGFIRTNEGFQNRRRNSLLW